MDSGYFSAQAVKDLLAVKEGEKDLLIKTIKNLESQIELLKNELSQFKRSL